MRHNGYIFVVKMPLHRFMGKILIEPVFAETIKNAAN